MNEIRINLSQWQKHEAPFVHPWVRYCQFNTVTATINLIMIKQQKVKINGARSSWNHASAAKLKLGRETETHQPPGIKLARPASSDQVEKTGLGGEADWIGLVDGRELFDHDST